jgi:hypothetical protein
MYRHTLSKITICGSSSVYANSVNLASNQKVVKAGCNQKAEISCNVMAYSENTNYGTDSIDSVDYPDFGHPVANDVNRR